MFTMTPITTQTALRAVDFVASESKKIAMLAERVIEPTIVESARANRERHIAIIGRIEAGAQTDEDKPAIASALGAYAAYCAQQSGLAVRRGDLELADQLDDRGLKCRVARAELVGNPMPTPDLTPERPVAAGDDDQD